MKYFASFFVCLFLFLSLVGFAENIQNLVQDPSFEDAPKGSDVWTKDSYSKDADTIIEFMDGGVSGKCLYIESKSKNHAYATQEINVEVGKTYKLSGMAKAEGVIGEKGANIGIMGTLTSTNDQKNTGGKYMPIECFINPKSSKITIMVALGGYGSETTGKAWFDNISLTEVKPSDVAQGDSVAQVGEPEKPATPNVDRNKRDNGWYGLIAFTVLTLLGSIRYLYL